MTFIFYFIVIIIIASSPSLSPSLPSSSSSSPSVRVSMSQHIGLFRGSPQSPISGLRFRTTVTHFATTVALSYGMESYTMFVRLIVTNNCYSFFVNSLSIACNNHMLSVRKFYNIVNIIKIKLSYKSYCSVLF